MPGFRGTMDMGIGKKNGTERGGKDSRWRARRAQSPGALGKCKKNHTQKNYGNKTEDGDQDEAHEQMH